ncbi:MAG: GTP-dependent dephospho-CoA kinase family protein [Nitrososphaerota archaeon]|nr:GTP-dependent dephospho-CoA kinase family protein [Nitrososphaerota archaeon]
MYEYIFSEELKEKVRFPIGKLLKDSEVTKENLQYYFDKSNLIVSVGDRTTERFSEFGLRPHLEIIDAVERKKKRTPPQLSANQTLFRAVNNAGTISSDALQNLLRCLDSITLEGKRARLIISGEEDLLVLPVMAFFPIGTCVFYGQPREGLVIVDSSESAQYARSLLLQIGVRSLS